MLTIDKQLELQLKREIFTSSYYEFFKWSFSVLFPNEKYEDAGHVKFLCDTYQEEIERIIRKEEKNEDIIVNVPPRSSKSLITSVSLNAWSWIKDPTIPFICISFDEDLSYLNAQYCKDLIKSDQFQELFSDMFAIRSDVDSKGFFQNDKGGFRLSKTTGSNITGHKGTVIIVDDPQSPKTAESEAHRKATIDYYTTSLYNRLTPANLGVRIIIMQRLHELDLTGYLLKHDRSSYKLIRLPSEYSKEVEPKELKTLYKSVEVEEDGQKKKVLLLDPIRLGIKVLRGFKKTLGTRGYTGQYDQLPSSKEGDVFKRSWFEIVNPSTIIRDIINEPVHILIDGAYTKKTTNDPSGILTLFKKNNYLYIVDSHDVWLEFPELCKHITNHASKFGVTQDSKILIEPKASGKSIVQQLRSTTMMNVIESTPPDTDKITRAHSISATVESSRIKLIEGYWNESFLDQVCSFPNAAHDERVDLLVMAVNELLINDNPDFLFL